MSGKKGRSGRRTFEAELRAAPPTVFVYWLPETGYGYAFNSEAEYFAALWRAIPKDHAAALDASRHDLVRYVRTRRT